MTCSYLSFHQNVTSVSWRTNQLCKTTPPENVLALTEHHFDNAVCDRFIKLDFSFNANWC